MHYVCYIDGSSLTNPGHAAIAVRIYDAVGCLLLSLCEPIGKQTNNYAEYYAVVRGLQEATRMQIDHLTVITDSELLSKQSSGEYKVLADNLKELYTEVQALRQQFAQIEIIYRKRESDERMMIVDKMAREAAEHVQRFGHHLLDDTV